MAFNTALSGLNAAAADLRVTGQNIANASTVGFKRSRAEFGDVYASTLLGNGTNLIGSGVKLANVAQQFEQGTIGFTNNSLDLAIDGNGFFILSEGGTRTYTRAGQLGIDEDGFVVTNSGARVQGFNVTDAGQVGGVLGDLRIGSENLQPRLTSLVNSAVNLDARAGVLSRIGSTLDTTGSAIGVARAGIPTATPSVVRTSGPPVPFDYSIDTQSSITAASAITPFDFSVNRPSAVAGRSAVNGFDFSVNSPSSLTGSAAPITFNFADKPSAINGTSNFTGFDFSGANASSFEVSIAGSSADGTRTVNLNGNVASLPALVSNINAQLAGIGVTARVDPANSTRLQFVSTVPGQASTVTVANFAPGGTATNNAISGVLAGITDGATSVRSSFDVSVAGATSNGTATVFLTANANSLPALIGDIRDQLATSGLSVDVREDPLNAGRLQFYSTDNGVASSVSVGNYRTSDAGVTTADIGNLLRLSSGSTSAMPGVGAIGVVGSRTRATFDVGISGGSGAGGNGTRTVVLDRNIPDGDLNGLVGLINGQLTGLDVRAEEDPAAPGRLRFVATVSGEASTVTVGNYQTSGVAGAVQTSADDITGVLGGITPGTTDATGNNTAATFNINLSGSSTSTENQTRAITLDSNINTLQDLINDIRDDLVGTGIGVDVRENPTQPGRLQFYSLRSGQAATITLSPTGVLQLGAGVTRNDVERSLGGISLGSASTSGASNVVPDPLGTGGAIGVVGNRTAASFDLTLAGASADNGRVSIELDSDINTLADLIADIRDELSTSGLGVDVREDPDNAGRLEFFATVPGEGSTITISNLDTSNIGVTQTNLANTLNLATGVTEVGSASVRNGYGAQAVNVLQADGTTATVSTAANASAAQIAAQFNNGTVTGVSADARTTASIPAASFTNASGTLRLALNGVTLTGGSLDAIADAINTASGLGAIDASIDDAGNLQVVDRTGADLVFSSVAGGASDTFEVQGAQGAPVLVSATGTNTAVAVGGNVEFTLEEGVTMASAVPTNNLFGSLGASAFTPFELNGFDPGNPQSYNHATSVTIYDSLGNPHTMSQYFVRERPDAASANLWSMYVQIDGENVGDPDPSLPPPANTLPTQAQFRVQFNPDGTLNVGGSDEILISNWTPKNADGITNGALGPLNALRGGTLPVPDPPTSSNFQIQLDDSTQFGAVFGVNAVAQNGFTTGRLAGIDIESDGLIFARYTNGRNQSLGQLGLADFANTQGLKPVGDTSWAQSGESGEPVIGTPASASLGVLTSGALEESNVDLSEQLVQLIIAQRNFQANARTISTSDEITQTIINI